MSFFIKGNEVEEKEFYAALDQAAKDLELERAEIDNERAVMVSRAATAFNVSEEDIKLLANLS